MSNPKLENRRCKADLWVITKSCCLNRGETKITRKCVCSKVLKVSKIKLTLMPKPHAHLQTMTKGPAKFQIDQYKVGGVVHTRYPR